MNIYYKMTTAIERLNVFRDVSKLNTARQLTYLEKEKKLKATNDLGILIINRMQDQQKIPINYILTRKLDNLRTNFISWIYLLSTKTEVSYSTLFNTISLLDELCGNLENEIIQDPSNFQLFAITCFFLSYKTFEKKKMTISFVEKYLLGNEWKEEEIRRAEIFVMERIDYNIHSINFYSFYQFYEQIIKKHFSDEMFKQIDFLVNFIMRQSLMIKDLIFNLNPYEIIKIILNTVFLLLQQLTGIDLNSFEAFFKEIACVSNNKIINKFEKYSGVLISNLKITEEFLEKFSLVQ